MDARLALARAPEMTGVNQPDGQISEKLSRCLVPESRGAILTRESEGALWQRFFTAAPAQRREFDPSSKRRKRRPVILPVVTA
jgi:hypothetical protein